MARALFLTGTRRHSAVYYQKVQRVVAEGLIGDVRFCKIWHSVNSKLRPMIPRGLNNISQLAALECVMNCGRASRVPGILRRVRR